MSLINILLIVGCIEATTELFLYKESIIYKLISLPAASLINYWWWKDFWLCGFCVSLRMSLLINLWWLFTDNYCYYLPVSLVLWRLSNTIHEVNTILIKKKIFMGARSGA